MKELEKSLSTQVALKIEYEGNKVRTLVQDGITWYSGLDIAKVFEYGNPN